MARFPSITVRELIESLQDEDQDAVIVFASDYGDYHHTRQVHAIDGTCAEQPIEESAYSHSGWAVVRIDDDTDADEPENDELPKVLVLS
jgi:hypothetical protein